VFNVQRGAIPPKIVRGENNFREGPSYQKDGDFMTQREVYSTVIDLTDRPPHSLTILIPTHNEEQTAAALCVAYADPDIQVRPRSPWFWREQVKVARFLLRRRSDFWIAPANYGIPVIRPLRTRTLLVVPGEVPILTAGSYLKPRPAWAAMLLVATSLALFSAELVLAVSRRTAADLYRLSRIAA
jgi:hypothetical protein